MKSKKEENNKKTVIYLVGIIVILAIVLFFLNSGREYGSTNSNIGHSTETGQGTSALEGEIKTTSDGTKYIINPNLIRGGGPPKGGIGVDRGIPALAEENINFVTVSEADDWIEDNELILVLLRGDIVRVYPLQIMVWHEIANDRINGDLIAVTYCPLCGSGIGYEAVVEVDGEKKETRFGTSGKLYNSNLVMYDELTDTYWQQIDGIAIVGELTGQELVEISVDTVVWRDFKTSSLAEDADVLSQNTGMTRAYGRDPYGNYYENSFLLFPVDNEDNSVHPKTPIVGIEVNGEFKAYREDEVRELGKIEDNVGGVDIIVESGEAGIIVITNKETGEEIVKERDFWFAWYAFHPDTNLYELE
ncbi:MAG: DUF3179 domain-containing protein [Candidatus Nanoarchaeia archaeon]